jgi:hypothetical protein
VLVSTTLVNVTPVMLEVMVALPPSPANVGADAVSVKVPESPGPVLVFCDVENWAVYTVAAPAAVAIAIGSAAAASKAPAANAFTKWRCIRLGLFIVNSLHS